MSSLVKDSEEIGIQRLALKDRNENSIPRIDWKDEIKDYSKVYEIKKTIKNDDIKNQIDSSKSKPTIHSGSIKQPSVKTFHSKKSPKVTDKIGEKKERGDKKQEGGDKKLLNDRRTVEDSNLKVSNTALGMVEAVTATTSKIASALRGKNPSSATLLATTANVVVGTTKNVLTTSPSMNTLNKIKKHQQRQAQSPKWIDSFDPRREPDMKFNDKVLAWLGNNPLPPQEAIKEGINQKSPYPALWFDTFSDYSNSSEGREQRMLKKSTKSSIEKYRKEPSKMGPQLLMNTPNTYSHIHSSSHSSGHSSIHTHPIAPPVATPIVPPPNHHPSPRPPSTNSPKNFLTNSNNFLHRLKNMHYHSRQNYSSHKKNDYNHSIDNSNDYLNYSTNNIPSKSDEDMRKVHESYVNSVTTPLPVGILGRTPIQCQYDEVDDSRNQDGYDLPVEVLLQTRNARDTLQREIEIQAAVGEVQTPMQIEEPSPQPQTPLQMISPSQVSYQQSSQQQTPPQSQNQLLPPQEGPPFQRRNTPPRPQYHYQIPTQTYKRNDFTRRFVPWATTKNSKNAAIPK